MSNNNVQAGKPIFDRKQFTRPLTTAEVAIHRERNPQQQQPARPKELVKVIARAERDEYEWLKQRVGRPIAVLLRSGDKWEHCKFIKLHTFSIVVKNGAGLECLLFKHAVAAICPEEP